MIADFSESLDFSNLPNWRLDGVDFHFASIDILRHFLAKLKQQKTSLKV